jgi:hypothetical protein
MISVFLENVFDEQITRGRRREQRKIYYNEHYLKSGWVLFR